MILSNLSTILGTKKLKISDLINDTGISRPTLTALYYNSGKGINFDTLEILCSYLKITPGDLLSFYNIDVESVDLEYTSYSKDNFIVSNMKVRMINNEYIGDANFRGTLRFKQQNLNTLNFNGWLSALKNNGKYSAVLNYHCDKSLYPEDVMSHIAHSLISQNLILKFPSKEIKSLNPIIIDYNNDTTKDFD